MKRCWVRARRCLFVFSVSPSPPGQLGNPQDPSLGLRKSPLWLSSRDCGLDVANPPLLSSRYGSESWEGWIGTCDCVNGPLPDEPMGLVVDFLFGAISTVKPVLRKTCARPKHLDSTCRAIPIHACAQKLTLLSPLPCNKLNQLEVVYQGFSPRRAFYGSTGKAALKSSVL